MQAQAVPWKPSLNAGIELRDLPLTPEEGFVALLHRCALEQKTPREILQWRDPDKKLPKAVDGTRSHLKLLEGPTVSVALRVTEPAAALMTTGVEVLTTVVVIGKFTLLVPAGSVAVAGPRSVSRRRRAARWAASSAPPDSRASSAT